MTESNIQSKPISEIRDKKSNKVLNDVQEGKQLHTIRILLVFARDGVTHADQIVTGMINFSHEVLIERLFYLTNENRSLDSFNRWILICYT